MSYRIGPRGRRIFLSEKLKMPNIIYICRSKIVGRREERRQNPESFPWERRFAI